VSEELAYNKEYEQYKILILERPLDPKFLVSSQILGLPMKSHIISEEEKPRITIFYFYYCENIQEKKTIANLFVHLSGKSGISISNSRHLEM
jgi:hypothetical protein